MTDKILFLLFRLLARWRLPNVAAVVLALTTRRMPIGKKDRGNERYRALIMTRLGFAEDIKASFHDANDFDVIYWPSFALKAFSSEILSPSLDHNNYLTTDPKIEATKEDFRRFLAALWRRYNGLKRVDVALTGNFAYFTEREFAVALEEAGTPFIALHKENVRPPRRVKEYWFTLYRERRGQFTGRRILVYNDVERELEIASGVIRPDRVTVTGMPRLDLLHRWRREHAGQPPARRPQVLFFAFARSDKLTAIQRKAATGVAGRMEQMDGEWGKLSWGQFCVDTHHAIVDLARARPDFDVIVKSKGQSRKLNDILQILDEIEEPLPANLAVLTSGDPFDLIAHANVVVGFNTTGLLEAIAAGKPVIVPLFGEACDPSRHDLLIDLGAAVEYARSPEELKKMIVRYAERPVPVPAALSAEAMRILNYWVGNADGCAGKRALDAIRAEIIKPSTESASTLESATAHVRSLTYAKLDRRSDGRA